MKITQVLKKQPFTRYDKNKILCTVSFGKGFAFQKKEEIHKMLFAFNTYTKSTCIIAMNTDEQTNSIEVSSYFIIVNKASLELFLNTLRDFKVNEHAENIYIEYNDVCEII